VIISTFLYLNIAITGSLGDICITGCTTLITELTSDPNLFTVDKSELPKTCSKVDAGISCLKEYLEKCLADGPVKTNTHGVLTGLESVMSICNQSQQEEDYLSHTPCYKQALEDNKNCSMEFQKHISVKDPQQQTQDKIGNLCRYYEEYLRCGERAIKKSCGPDAVKYFHAYKQKLQLPMKNLCPSSDTTTVQKDGRDPHAEDEHSHAEDKHSHAEGDHSHEHNDEPADSEDSHAEDHDGSSATTVTSSTCSILVISVLSYLVKI